MQRSSSAGALPSPSAAAFPARPLRPAAAENEFLGAKLFAALLAVDDGSMKSDYHGPDGWDVEALQADLVTLGGAVSGTVTEEPTLEEASSSSTVLCSFEPADTFGGARPGHVFKCGPSGTGYYVDTPLHEQPLQELLAAVTIGSAVDNADSPPPERASGFARPAGSSTAGLAKAIADDLRGIGR